SRSCRALWSSGVCMCLVCLVWLYLRVYTSRATRGIACGIRHNTVVGAFPLAPWTDALRLVAPTARPAESATDTTAQLIAHLRATSTSLGCLFIAGDRAGVGKTRWASTLSNALLRRKMSRKFTMRTLLFEQCVPGHFSWSPTCRLPAQ